MLTKNRTLSTAVALAVASGLGVASADSASAKVTQSCAWFQSPGSVKGVPLYKGNICGALDRDGLEVKKLKYAFTSYGKVCNWWVDFDFYDGRTRERYYHSQGAVQGCQKVTSGTRTGGMPINARTGQMCVTLFQNRTTQIDRVVSTCQDIQPAVRVPRHREPPSRWGGGSVVPGLGAA